MSRCTCNRGPKTLAWRVYRHLPGHVVPEPFFRYEDAVLRARALAFCNLKTYCVRRVYL